MATITVTQAQFLRSAPGATPVYDGGPERAGIKEAASQSWGIGAPIYADATTGLATVCSGNDVALLLGFAAKAATGTTNTAVKYRPVRGGDRYLMSRDTGVTAQGDIGDVYGVAISSGKMVVYTAGSALSAAESTTQVAVKIVGLYTSDFGYPGSVEVAGDTTAHYIVEFISNFCLHG